MRRWRALALRVALATVTTWGTAALCSRLNGNHSVASMILVLEVLGFATFGDRLLAILASGIASMAFSWYFVDTVGSFQITSVEGGLTYSMMLATALLGSNMAMRAQRRADEAIKRREEMEQLQQLGQAMIATGSVAEAAVNIVQKVVELFGVRGARLHVEGLPEWFKAGDLVEPRSRVNLNSLSSRSTLELYGSRPSEEVLNALGNLVSLVLDRAASAEQRSRIEAAQRGDELRTTVLNALAHNFKTPLTSIKAASSMLCSSETLSSEMKEMATIIDEEADRLSGLIRDSLDLAKLESRTENPRRELCSLGDITQTVTVRAARYLRGRNLVVNIPEDLPSVWGDPFLFEQMLTQVVDNAWKYSKPGTDIRIEAEQRGDDLVLVVQNQGVRIPDEEREKIFSKFYRGSVSRSQVEGTGLGLAIARTIVEAHGGNIWLNSEPEGPAFCFSLPVGEVVETDD